MLTNDQLRTVFYLEDDNYDDYYNTIRNLYNRIMTNRTFRLMQNMDNQLIHNSVRLAHNVNNYPPDFDFVFQFYLFIFETLDMLDAARTGLRLFIDILQTNDNATVNYFFSNLYFYLTNRLINVPGNPPFIFMMEYFKRNIVFPLNINGHVERIIFNPYIEPSNAYGMNSIIYNLFQHFRSRIQISRSDVRFARYLNSIHEIRQEMQDINRNLNNDYQNNGNYLNILNNQNARVIRNNVVYRVIPSNRYGFVENDQALQDALNNSLYET